MSTTDKASKNLSEEDIDRIVVAQAADDSAWDDPIVVQKAAGSIVDRPRSAVVECLYQMME